MTDKELIKALSRLVINTRSLAYLGFGSLACLGCGHEHSCGIHGCAIMRAAADRIEELSASPWISVKDRLPELEGVFLVIVDGKPTTTITLINAVEIAEYWRDEGWFIEAYPEWENPNITYWMPIPEMPGEEAE
ncbi:MAG: DUF551 domain-containing protein [Acutalibacteraceae bacterium]